MVRGRQPFGELRPSVVQSFHHVFDQLDQVELLRSLPEIIIADDPDSRVVGARTHRTIKHPQKQLQNNVRGLLCCFAQRVSSLPIELHLCIPQATSFPVGLLTGVVKIGALRFALLPMQSLKRLQLLLKLPLDMGVGILRIQRGLLAQTLGLCTIRLRLFQRPIR